MSTIKTSIGRLSMMVLVLGSAMLSFIALFITGSGGAISDENSKEVINELLKIYLPLIGFMTAFYFGQAKKSTNKDTTSIETFSFSIITVALWVLCPPIFIYYGQEIEKVLNTINLLTPYGETVAAAGAAFYFAKSR